MEILKPSFKSATYLLLLTIMTEIVLTQLKYPTLSDLFTSLGDFSTQYSRLFGKKTYEVFYSIYELINLHRLYTILIEPIIMLNYKILRFLFGPVYYFLVGFVNEYPNLSTGLAVTLFILIVMYSVLLISEICGLNFKSNYKPSLLFKWFRQNAISPLFSTFGITFAYVVTVPYEVLYFLKVDIVITAVRDLSSSIISIFSNIPLYFYSGYLSVFNMEYYKKNSDFIGVVFFAALMASILAIRYYYCISLDKFCGE